MIAVIVLGKGEISPFFIRGRWVDENI